MSQGLKVGSLFNPAPRRWGLRGDPYLWRALQARLAKTILPATVSKFVAILEDEFRMETGRRLAVGPHFVLEKFACGGMSSGGVDPQFWCGRAVPLLVQRYCRAIANQFEKDPTFSEKDLDREIEAAFQMDPSFVKWFLAKCHAQTTSAVYSWSRSDHPWTTVECQVENEKSGEPELLRREGETDILVVLTAKTGRRLGIHIEHKTHSGKFTKYQGDMYSARAEKWKNNPEYGNYQDAITVLIAPGSFLNKYKMGAAKFDAVISYEALSTTLPAFASRDT
jgi:hypothetical protein